ncbi:MAG: matrixin family metalloprotease [Cephaloticoccus sp.]
MTPSKFLRAILVAVLGLAVTLTAPAYLTYKDSSKIYVVVWDPGSVPMRIKLPAPSATLIDGSTSYATPVLAAMQMWNSQMGVVQLSGSVVAGTTYATGNNLNEIAMDSKADGDDFPERTLAVTLTYRVGNRKTEGDIVFNTAYTWNSYRGNLRSTSEDIRRVALHELGHVLSLLHPDDDEPAQSVAAIMNSTVGNLENLTSDDIAGAQYLYGAPGVSPVNDNFANATLIALNSGTAQVAGATIGGTAQAGEPSHDGETPAHSVWWRWVAPSNVTANLTTLGSNFDTVVGVYTGGAVGALTRITSNDDEESGVIRTSKLSFEAVAGTTYYFAVDGWNSYYGQVVLALSLGASSGGGSGLPTITTQPLSRSAPVGGAVSFTVEAGNSPTGYQWYFNGNAISGATSSTYTVATVAAGNAGNYAVTVTNAAGSVTSATAVLSVFTPELSAQVVTSGHDVSLVAPTLTGSYRWQVSTNGGSTWSDLADNSTYSGTGTATLTITSAGTNLNDARYRYTVTSGGGTVTGTAITLTVSAVVIPFPVAIAVDGSGNLYVADSSTHLIQKVNSAGTVTTLAGGSGSAGSTDGTGTAARFNQPAGVTSTSGAVLTVADTANATIRRVSAAGVVTTAAGSTTLRGAADGAGTAATFRLPIGLGQNAAGTVYIADATNHVIRAVDASNNVTTLAGAAGSSGSADGTGGSARFNYPSGIAVDAAGNVYVADTTNNLIRKVTSGGVVTTLAGVVGVSGWQDGTGSGALFNQPQGLASDSAGNLYVADTGNSAVRKITPAGLVTTLAGLSTIGGLKDGTGTGAGLNQPRAVAVDGSGNVYVADTGNAAIRKVTSAGGVTTLVLTAGATNSGGSSGSGGGTSTPSTGSSSGGGGGGGGGAPSLWFLAALGAAAGLRRWWGSR